MVKRYWVQFFTRLSWIVYSPTFRVKNSAQLIRIDNFEYNEALMTGGRSKDFETYLRCFSVNTRPVEPILNISGRPVRSSISSKFVLPTLSTLHVWWNSKEQKENCRSAVVHFLWRNLSNFVHKSRCSVSLMTGTSTHTARMWRP